MLPQNTSTQSFAQVQYENIFSHEHIKQRIQVTKISKNNEMKISESEVICPQKYQRTYHRTSRKSPPLLHNSHNTSHLDKSTKESSKKNKRGHKVCGLALAHNWPLSTLCWSRSFGSRGTLLIKPPRHQRAGPFPAIMTNKAVDTRDRTIILGPLCWAAWLEWELRRRIPPSEQLVGSARLQ